MARIILGLGTGRCGTRSLARVLSLQPDTHVTHEQPPLLPWRPYPKGPGINERLNRISNKRNKPVVGDVASFYLPYIESAISMVPDVRVVCLKRPCEEVVESFCRWVDKVHRLPTNHWAREPATGWHHEPVYTQIFPQYDTQDREEGIRRYWNEYYEKAEELERRFPDNVRIFETNSTLNTEDGLRSLLTFCEYASAEQVLAVGTREYESEQAPVRQAPGASSSNVHDPRRCVVLVPHMGQIVSRCEDALKELERRGYPVRRVSGYAAIDQGRNQIVTDALCDGFLETMWIDSDVGFHPNAVDRLRSHELPIVCGIYPKKGKREVACHVMPGTEKLLFGKQGGLREVLYAGMGFVHVRREVYEQIQHGLRLPVCNQQYPRPMIPFFQPLIEPWNDGHWYLAEDYSFCRRARDCGFKIVADTRIRLWHVGTYPYGWEDAGREPERVESYTLRLTPRGNNQNRDG